MNMFPAHRIPIRMFAGVVLAACVTTAQTPDRGPILSFTATTDNVAGAPVSARIDLFRWSTDGERDQVLSAWKTTGASARQRRGVPGARVAAVDSAPDPAAPDGDPSTTFGAGPNLGRRGSADAPPTSPESSLATAVKQAPTVGYLWSSEVAGYALRYAGEVPGPDGVQRIILITDRRLGATNDRWKPVEPGAPATYDFSVIELRVNSKGEGEGKISLIGNVAPDSAAHMVVPENYDALPVVLKNLKRRPVEAQ